MPTIKKLERKKKNNNLQPTEHRELRKEAYGSIAWKKLRIVKLADSPICEECLKAGKVNAGSPENPLQIHHKVSPFDYKENKINWTLFLDIDNLETVCSQCHKKEHHKMSGYESCEEIIAALDALFDENKSDKEIDQW